MTLKRNSVQTQQ